MSHLGRVGSVYIFNRYRYLLSQNTHIQWNLFMTRSLGPEGCLVMSSFPLCRGKGTRKYGELGPAGLPYYGRVLLCPTSL